MSAWTLLQVRALLFPLWSFYCVPWILGAGTALAARITGRSGWQSVGIGLMSVPAWDTLWGILDSLGPLVQGGLVLQPYSRHDLSSLYEFKFLSDLGYLGVGFLVYSSASLPDLWHQTPRRLAGALAWVGLPLGRLAAGLQRRGLASGRWGEGRALTAGVALFPLLLLVTIAIDAVLSGVRSLNQSDESSVFANMTVYHALLISLAAGFGEELLFRGLVLVGLARAADRLERTAAQRSASGGRPGAVAMVVAIVVQSVFFGLAHAGYGTWIHVLTPALFGLVAGAVAWAFGIWASIALHTLVDVFAFGVEAARHASWVNGALSGFLFADSILLLGLTVWALVQLSRRTSRKQTRQT